MLRKRKSLSSAIVSCGDVAEGEITGTPASAATDSTTASVIDEASGPTIAWTPFHLDQAAGLLGRLGRVERGVAGHDCDRIGPTRRPPG